MHRCTADMAASVMCALYALWRLLYCVQLNFQLKATGPTVTKFFMVMTGYIHWAGCMYYLLSELVIRFNIIDGDPTIEVAPNILCSVGGQSIVLRFRISCRTSPGATVRHVPGLTM